MIVFCYLGSPMHHQIGVVFHEVSHLFIMPNSVMSHVPIQKQEELFHYSNEHVYYQMDKQHQIVDLFNLIFDAANDSGEPDGDSLLTHIKLDRHLTNEQYTFQINDLTNHHSNPILQLVMKVDIGHIQVLDEPPEIF